MKFLLLIGLVAGTWASAADAVDLQSFSLGASQPDVMQSVQQSGLALVPVPSSAGSPRSVFLLGSDNPAQLEFCQGLLVRLTEAIGGGIHGFLSRSEAEVRRLGLPLPHLEQEEGQGEIAFSEWTLPAGGHLVVAWTADDAGALGTVTRESPCTPNPGKGAPAVAAALPSAAAAPPPAGGGKAPASSAPSPGVAEGNAPPAQASLPAAVYARTPPPPGRSAAVEIKISPPATPAATASSVDVKVPLPEVDPHLIVNDVLAPSLAGAPAAGDIPTTVAPSRRSAVRPEPKPLPRSVAGRPEVPPSDATAAVSRPPAAKSLNAARQSLKPRVRPSTSAPLQIFPNRRPETVEVDPAEPETTNAIGAANGPDRAGADAAGPGPGVEALLPKTAQAPGPAPFGQAAGVPRYERPASREQCSRAFRSYNATTGTYRAVSGQVIACP